MSWWPVAIIVFGVNFTGWAAIGLARLIVRGAVTVGVQSDVAAYRRDIDAGVDSHIDICSRTAGAGYSQYRCCDIFFLRKYFLF